MTYRISTTGYNAALVALTVLVPQPRCEGLQVTRRDFVGNGSFVEQGLFVEWLWNVNGSVAQYQGILTQLGLSTVKSLPVTIYSVDDQYIFRRWNGTIIRPQPGVDVRRNNFFVRDITVLIRDLVMIA